MPSGRWPPAAITGMVPPIPGGRSHDRRKTGRRAGPNHTGGPGVPRHHLGRLGIQLAGHQYLLGELPPLTLRGSTGVVGAVLLGLLALLRGQSLRVPRHLWPRLVLAAILNVGCWMVLMVWRCCGFRPAKPP